MGWNNRSQIKKEFDVLFPAFAFITHFAVHIFFKSICYILTTTHIFIYEERIIYSVFLLNKTLLLQLNNSYNVIIV